MDLMLIIDRHGMKEPVGKLHPRILVSRERLKQPGTQRIGNMIQIKERHGLLVLPVDLGIEPLLPGERGRIGSPRFLLELPDILLLAARPLLTLGLGRGVADDLTALLAAREEATALREVPAGMYADIIPVKLLGLPHGLLIAVRDYRIVFHSLEYIP